MIMEAMEAAEELESPTECGETAEDFSQREYETDDHGREYRTDDGGRLPNNTYELDGIEYKTDDMGHIYQHDGKYYPDDFFVLDGEMYTTDADGNLMQEIPAEGSIEKPKDPVCSDRSADAGEPEFPEALKDLGEPQWEKTNENGETLWGYTNAEGFIDWYNSEGVFDSQENPEEMSEEDINEAQRAAIQEAFERIANGEELSNAEKGNLCEMMMDQYYISQGYTPLHDRVTSLDDSGHQGIDGVYEKENADGTKEYIIADAKYGASPLGESADGKQLSDSWIDANLDKAVGKEKADEIRSAYEDDPDSISRQVYHYDPHTDTDGCTNSDISTVNTEGISNHEKTVVERFDEDGSKIPNIENKNEAETVGETYA